MITVKNIDLVKFNNEGKEETRKNIPKPVGFFLSIDELKIFLDKTFNMGEWRLSTEKQMVCNFVRDEISFVLYVDLA